MKRFLPQCEPLECRLNPAGTVTGSFANGTWTLIGDADANDILVNPGLEPGEFSVTGLSGTEVTGATKASNVKNIVIKLGEGDDFVEFNNTAESKRLSGKLQIFGGHGDNRFVIDRVHIGQSLSVTNGRGFDDLDVGNSLIDGHVVINNGHGGSEVIIDRDDTEAISAIGGNLIIHNGRGADFVIVRDTHVGGNIDVQNGQASAGGSAGEFIIYNNYDGVSRSIIRGNVSVSYQNGEIGSDGIFDAEVLGNVKFDYGNAESELYFDGYLVDQPVHIHGSLTILGQGEVRVGTGQIEQGTGLIVDGSLTIQTGGQADWIEATHLQVGGVSQISTGGGNDRVFIDDSSFAGPVRIQTGGGMDEVLIDNKVGTVFGTLFGRAFNVDLGGGSDTLRLGIVDDPTAIVELLAGGQWNGGAGFDALDWYNVNAAFGYPDMVSFEGQSA